MAAAARTLRDALLRAGLGDPEAGAKAARLTALSRALEQHGHDPAGIRLWFVPGRIEVLGKHTDYAGGRSLTCAAERGFCLAVAPRRDGEVTVTDAVRSSTLRSALEPEGPPADVRWFTYALTVIRRLARNFPEARAGADIVLAGDLPTASGVSSSSALMVGIALGLVEVNELRRTARWREAITSAEDEAGYFAAMENGSAFGPLPGDEGVGTAGGSEDHTAILCSSPGELAQYRFCPTRREATIELSPDLVFVIGSSGMAARKTGGARAQYNRASRAAVRLLSHWRHATGRGDHSLGDALRSAPDAPARARAIAAAATDQEFSGAELAQRLDHFLEESERLVPAAAAALERGDLPGFAAAAVRSQEIAEHLLQNQVPATVGLARLAEGAGAIAASSFGAGFGGSVWALVPRDVLPGFVDRWFRPYAEEFPLAASRAAFFATRPGPAAFEITAGC